MRQRFELGGAEGEGASHLGLNWMRVEEVAAGGVSFAVSCFDGVVARGKVGGVRGDMSVIRRA